MDDCCVDDIFSSAAPKKNCHIFCVGTLHGHLVRKIKNASFSFVVIFVCSLLPSVPFFPALACRFICRR
jgi:hypothetical protein